MSTTYRVLREKEETVVRERQGRRVYESDLLNDGSIDPVSLKVFSHRKEQFFQIEKGAIFPNTLVDFSVFKQKRLVFHPVIEAGPENPVLIEKGHIDYIKQDPICELAIYRKDILRHTLT